MSRLRLTFLVALTCCMLPLSASALGEPQYVVNTPAAGDFALVAGHTAAPLIVSRNDWWGVIHAAGDLRTDIDHVTGVEPTLLRAPAKINAQNAVLIGTIGKSPLIDTLIRQHKLDVTGIAGQWESAVTTIVDNPMPGVRRALVIAGSDKRGTIYAIYDLSEQSGVSPWYWWADVRIPHHDALYVEPGRHIQPVPAVKYRGIFLNDEAPSLTDWVDEKFGGYNSKFYTHVFELLLRLKANYLWPAMWNSAFDVDDPLNPKLANAYGIVMGTSHEEPMMCAEKEWKPSYGPWDYVTNSKRIDQFWRGCIERDKNYDEIVTLGMRGHNDTPILASGTMTQKIALMEKIIAKQREILKQNMNPDLDQIPQMWALYKEVESYYTHGMRVPDDVTLLWSDDNWGDLRRLPTPAERKRSGGAGIYYHFDYVGAPRSYKWVNTYPITKVQEQMNLAYHYGANRIWVVNVGDLQPKAFPVSFFLSMARTPKRWNKDHLDEFTLLWAKQQFGPAHAREIATAIEEYTKYNGRRKPDLITPQTFSLRNFNEAARVDAQWQSLAARVNKLATELPADERASYFELVQYPVDACANVTEMYIAAGHNALYAHQGRASANYYADLTRKLFARDAELSYKYNHQLNGKWNHMMDQTHIGWTSWNQPPLNVMPAVSWVQPATDATLGVSTNYGTAYHPSLGLFDSVAQQTRTLTIFNRGLTPVKFDIATSSPWIRVSQSTGTVSTQDLPVQVSVDWATAPANPATGTITVTQAGAAPIVVSLKTMRIPGITRANAQGFVESNGYVSINAADTTARTADSSEQWELMPDYGETKSAMSIFPVTAASNLDSKAGLQYRMYLYDSGHFTLRVVMAPTLGFVPGRGLRFAVSVDNGPRTVVNTLAHADWAKDVTNSVRRVDVPLTISTPGYHTLKIWAVDPGVVIERIVVFHGNLPYSYLGPPESFHGPSGTVTSNMPAPSR